MRNLYILLGRILKLIPDDEVTFKSALELYRKKSMYVAPEVMYEIWTDVDTAIQMHITYRIIGENDEEWKYQVISEWCMGNIDEIKKSFKDRV